MSLLTSSDHHNRVAVFEYPPKPLTLEPTMLGCVDLEPLRITASIAACPAPADTEARRNGEPNLGGSRRALGNTRAATVTFLVDVPDLAPFESLHLVGDISVDIGVEAATQCTLLSPASLRHTRPFSHVVRPPTTAITSQVELPEEAITGDTAALRGVIRLTVLEATLLTSTGESLHRALHLPTFVTRRLQQENKAKYMRAAELERALRTANVLCARLEKELEAARGTGHAEVARREAVIASRAAELATTNAALATRDAELGALRALVEQRGADYVSLQRDAAHLTAELVELRRVAKEQTEKLESDRHAAASTAPVSSLKAIIAALGQIVERGEPTELAVVKGELNDMIKEIGAKLEEATECVVCHDRTANLQYNCSHVCCCDVCGANGRMAHCPLCRALIVHRTRVSPQEAGCIQAQLRRMQGSR